VVQHIKIKRCGVVVMFPVKDIQVFFCDDNMGVVTLQVVVKIDLVIVWFHLPDIVSCATNQGSGQLKELCP
jgi:hypothetical protein